LLREVCEPERLITFARAVSTPDEDIKTVALQTAEPEMADMRTVVLLGSSRTRTITRDGQAPIVYTPRSVPG
jgi:precorrin-3B C17-methyltransferase